MCWRVSVLLHGSNGEDYKKQFFSLQTKWLWAQISFQSLIFLPTFPTFYHLPTTFIIYDQSLLSFTLLLPFFVILLPTFTSFYHLPSNSVTLHLFLLIFILLLLTFHYLPPTSALLRVCNCYKTQKMCKKLLIFVLLCQILSLIAINLKK